MIYTTLSLANEKKNILLVAQVVFKPIFLSGQDLQCIISFALSAQLNVSVFWCCQPSYLTSQFKVVIIFIVVIGSSRNLKYDFWFIDCGFFHI